MKLWLMIQKYVAPKKPYTFRSPSEKEKQLYHVVLDKRNRRYCTDAEANDMIHLGRDHRSVTAHGRIPCAETKGGLENKKQKQNLFKDTRYAKYPSSMTPREDPDSEEKLLENEGIF